MLLFIFTISIPAWCYTSKDMDLTDYEFRRYVRPQLRSILQDYKSLIIILNDNLSPFKEDIGLFRSLIGQASKIQTKCKNLNNEYCFEYYEKIHKQYIKLLKNIEKQQVPLSEKDKIDRQIFAWNMLENVKQELFNSFFRLDAGLLEYQIKGQINMFPKELVTLLEKSYLIFNLFLLENSKESYRKKFHAYWLSFIKPVYKFILIQDNKKYFQDNLTDLNIAWNEINVYLTKRNKNVPKQAITLVNIMHNRWNRILKVTLKPIP
jgi:hypothetical protein